MKDPINLSDLIRIIISGKNKVNIKYVNMDKFHAKIIAHILTYPECKIKKIDLYGNLISDDGAILLTKAMINPNCKLEKIHLNGNNISDYGATKIASALNNPYCKIKLLNLELNSITDKGIATLNHASTNKNLTIMS